MSSRNLQPGRAKTTFEYNLSNKFDNVGRCANLATKVVHGGCFVEGTLVTVSSLPGRSSPSDSLWSDPSWLDEPSPETPWLAPDRYASVATRTELQVPIESVPIGSRVPTKNPNRFEVDPEPEPEQATWAKLSITAEGSDGGIVDAEIIRPRSWILRNGICAGRMLPFNLPELEVSGLALVTAIDDCPPIADGEGSVVTARFVTREVHVVASVDVLGADGTVETITGTTIHPVWSVDRQEWVPLAELVDGERLQGLDGLAVVLSVTLSRVSQPVYNIEVHGEHVYQVGELGLVVHNACVPKVTDAKLGNLVNDLFKGAKMPNPIGTGSTADAVRNELITGLPTHGRFHSQKANEYINALTNWLKKNPNAPHHDQLVARSLIGDLRAALGGN
jgi:hypothetical protein